MIEAVVGLQQASVVQDLHSLPAQKVELSSEPLQRPSDVQAADFVRAAAPTPIPEVNAVPAASGWTDGVAHQMDGLASRLNTLGANRKASDVAAPENSRTLKADNEEAPNNKEVMDGAVDKMERAYVFAIEATMASHGATEATQIFNALLKGQ
jgi:hypothetical protein